MTILEHMRHAISAVVAVMLIIILTVGSFMATAPEPASADPVVTCELVTGPVTRVVCTAAGVVVLNTVVDLPTVNVPGPTVTAQGHTVTLPPVTLPPQAQGTPQGPRNTVTVAVPGPTVAGPTVRIPGPTKTVTKNVAGPTRTVTKPPKPQSTVTQTATTTATATETIVAEPTGQTDPDSGRVDDNEPDNGFFTPGIDFGDDNVTVGEAGIGLLSALLIIAMILSGMGYGFRRGLKAGRAGESDFLRAVLDRSKTT